MPPNLAVVIRNAREDDYRCGEAHDWSYWAKILPRIYPEIRINTPFEPEEPFDLWFFKGDVNDALRRSEHLLVSRRIRKRISMWTWGAPYFDVCFVPFVSETYRWPNCYLDPDIVEPLDKEWVLSRPRDYVFWHSSDHWDEWQQHTRTLDEVLVPRLQETGVKRIVLAHWDRRGMIRVPRDIDVSLLPVFNSYSDAAYQDIVAGAALFVISNGGNRPHSINEAMGYGVPAIVCLRMSQRSDTLLPDSDLSIIGDHEGYWQRHLAELSKHNLDAMTDYVQRAIA